MKRKPGWTWVQAVLASPWSKTFEGMHDPEGWRRACNDYLREGKFTFRQRKYLLPEARRIYESPKMTRKYNYKPASFPPSLEK